MEADQEMLIAIAALTKARKAFKDAIDKKLILGNDNHVGDIGEYWVRKYLEKDFKFKQYAPNKNSLYDIEMSDGTRVSVKTITPWSKTGFGTQVKPLCGKNWSLLAAVLLNEKFFPEKIALIPLEKLISHEHFIRNDARRKAKNTFAYPRFQWWSWLDDFIVHQYSRQALNTQTSKESGSNT